MDKQEVNCSALYLHICPVIRLPPPSAFVIFSPSADPHIEWLSQSEVDGRSLVWRQIRKQLTAVQEVHNKGHNEPQARKEATVCVRAYVCVCKYVHALFSAVPCGVERRLNTIDAMCHSYFCCLKITKQCLIINTTTLQNKPLYYFNEVSTWWYCNICSYIIWRSF